MRVLVIPIALVLALLSTGCAKFYWTRANTTEEQFNRDSHECAKDSSPGPGTTVKEYKINSQLYRACLTARGYLRDKYLISPTPSWRGASDL